MRHSEFVGSPSGRLKPTTQGVWGFVPNPLPPELNVGAVSRELEDASLKLGELNGIGTMLPDPYLLIHPLQRREAVASSAIEGTLTTLSDLFLFEAGADEARRPPDTREVWNYVRALEHENIPRIPEINS